jgi:hypothetical protein
MLTCTIFNIIYEISGVFFIKTTIATINNPVSDNIINVDNNFNIYESIVGCSDLSFEFNEPVLTASWDELYNSFLPFKNNNIITNKNSPNKIVVVDKILYFFIML